MATISDHSKRQAPDPGGRSTPHGHVEDLLGDLRHALEDGPPARQHHAAVEAAVEAGAPDLGQGELADLLRPRLEHVAQHLAGHDPGLAPSDRGNFDRVVLRNHRDQRAPMLLLDLLRLVHRGPQGHGDVVREMLAADL